MQVLHTCDALALGLVEAVIQQARADARTGYPDALAWLAWLRGEAPEPPPVELDRAGDVAPVEAVPVRASRYAPVIWAEARALGYPARPMPRGTVPALAERLGISRNSVYEHLRALGAPPGRAVAAD